MNIQYPVSEILRCVDYINDPKEEIYESSNKILVLNNSLTMKKKNKKNKKIRELNCAALSNKKNNKVG